MVGEVHCEGKECYKHLARLQIRRVSGRILVVFYMCKCLYSTGDMIDLLCVDPKDRFRVLVHSTMFGRLLPYCYSGLCFLCGLIFRLSDSQRATATDERTKGATNHQRPRHANLVKLQFIANGHVLRLISPFSRPEYRCSQYIAGPLPDQPIHLVSLSHEGRKARSPGIGGLANLPFVFAWEIGTVRVGFGSSPSHFLQAYDFSLARKILGRL